MANHKRNHGIGPGGLAPVLLAWPWLLLTWLLWFGWPAAHASENTLDAMADTVFHHITPEQGLPHPVVTAIAQTGDGFIWIGTENGLARWDGYRFRHYSTESGNERAGNLNPGASLPDNSITKLFADRQGQLWLIFNNGNLARYDVRRDQFTLSPLVHSKHALRLNSITDDRQGNILVGTNHGLVQVSSDGSKVSWRHLVRNDGHDLSGEAVGSVQQDKNGRFWISTAQGLWQQAAADAPLVPVALPASSGATSGPGLLKNLRDGRILVSSVIHGVLLIDPDTGRISQAPLDAASRSAFEQVSFATMLEVLPGEIWFGSFTQGIVRLNLASGQIKKLQHDPAFATSLAVDAVNFMLLDRTGLVWVATQRGVSWHDPNRTAVLNLFSKPGQANRIQGADVRSILPVAADRIWLGLSGQGVNLLDPRAQSVSVALPLLARRMVQGICQVPQGDLYFASDKGLVRSNSLGQQAMEVPVVGGIAGNQTGVVDYFANRLWVGSVDGLWQLDPALPQAVLQRVAGTQALAGVTIRTLVWDGKHSLWIGTNSSGLYHYQMQHQRLEKIALP
ncbi:MAG: hypothetical protein RL748_3160, partial [Pseudomonadota bacterium]